MYEVQINTLITAHEIKYKMLIVRVKCSLWVKIISTHSKSAIYSYRNNYRNIVTVKKSNHLALGR